MKTTHGPWFARDNGHFWEVVVSPDEFARSVADVPVTVRQPNEEAEKVARLLASAPDLLAECDRLKTLNAELVEALNYAVEFSTEAAMHWDSDYDAKVGKYLLALSGSNKGYDKRTDALHAALAKHKGETE